jgi:hypothetical protein
MKAGNWIFSFFRGSAACREENSLLDAKAKINMKMFRFLLCILTGVLISPLSARANVYATDIQINGNLTNASATIGSPASITYRLNQAADLGVTVKVLQGTNVVAAMTGGTNMGLNSVSWTPTVGGTYSLSITAAASGFTNWEQISVDTNAGNYAFDPGGIAVDNNTNSPYYGRVLVGCAFANGTATNPISGALILDGIYKMNADGSFADEGGFGYGGYSTDDAGQIATNEMPPYYAAVPWRLRMGDDDRIYMLDWSDEGAIVSFDIEVTAYKIVIDDGGYFAGALGGPHNYASNPDIGDIAYGIINFDVSSPSTTNGAVWLCDSDYPNWGIWMYHLANGQSVTNDSGTQAVTTGGDLSLVSSGGCTVDTNLDIFCGQTRNHENAVYDVMDFTNWNDGVLPPISSGYNFVDGTVAGEVAWGYGCGVDVTCATDPGFEAVEDVVIDSRTSPKFVACPLGAGDLNGIVTYTTNVTDDFTTNTTTGVITTNYVTNITTAGSGGGIRVLNAIDGSIATFTNGSYTESLTNLDWDQQYNCAAWDNVGNLYAASPTRNVWRVWSPPGTNTNTTFAVAQIIVGLPVFQIATATFVSTGPGSGNVTINFTAPGDPAPSVFTLLSSPTLIGTYTPVTGAVITGGSGNYQATFSSTSTQFYEIKQSP